MPFLPEPLATPVPHRFRLALVATLALAGAAASAQTLDVGGRRCAVPNPTLAEVVESVRIVEEVRQRRPPGAALLAAAEPVTIPVAFHVVSFEGEGEVPLERIEAQIDTLNAAFASAGYRFVLSVVERVENEAWYDGLLIGSEEEAEMMAALALDPAVYLNVYTANLGLDYLGWATLPDAASETDVEQGVVLLDESLPGGSAAPYNLGHTGTHEVGHWMGLFHTFQGGCSSPNDGVADTPWERSGAEGCPQNRDSCTLEQYGEAAAGLDPVTNYMDYSDDACMTGFTAGQDERVRAMVEQFRPTLAAGEVVVADVARSAFRDVAVGEEQEAPLAVTNLRAEPVTITAASSSNAAFSVAGLPVTVPAGGVATLTATFAPSASGVQAAVLTLETDGAGPLAASVVGTTERLPSLVLRAPSVQVETVEEGAAAATVALANGGGQPLSFAVETVGLPGWVTEVSPTAGTVAGGEAVTVDVQVSAADLEAGTYGTTLIVTSNDPTATQTEIPLALVVQPRPEVRVSAAAPQVELIENDAASATVTLANDGAGELSFQVVSAALPTGIETVVPLSGTVAPGAERALTVSFSSSSVPVGVYQATIEVQTNDPFRPVLEVPVAFTVRERPGALAVQPIYPNPGRGTVTVPLAVPADSDARAEVFDVRGRLVATLYDGPIADGYPTLTWDASAAPAGVYVVRVQTASAVAVGTVVIAR